MKVVFHIVNYTNLCKPTVRMNKGKKIAITRPYDNVKDVNDSKDVWSLAVRVMDLWCVTGKYRQEQYLEMVIADKENDMIQLTVPYEELAKWKEILKENNTYTMLNFKVLKNDVAVKASTHPFRLAVSGATIIKPVDFPAIPLASFRFKDFGEILAGNYRNDLLIDVIGAFQDITNTNKKGTIIRSVTFLLKDASGLMIHATLWDEFAKQFFDAFNQANGPETIFIVLKHMRAREAQGIYPLCVTNTWSGTKVIINAEIPEIAEFKTRFAELPIDDVNASQQLSQLTQGSQITQQGDIMNKAHFLTLSEVNHVMHETICVTIAEIKKINANKYGWIYDGCNFCTKGVRMDNGQLKCRGNHINDEAKPRFRVEVEAVYKNDKAKFLLWDNDVASIIGMSAQELKEQLVEIGQFHPTAYPPILDQVVCPQKVFKIKACPGSSPYSVIQISDNEGLLKNLEKQFGLGEQSLCDETDPSCSSATPPPKRNSQEDVDWVGSTQDVEATQLSSTKLAKQPKLEPKN
ncbi:DUF223 domain protein [Medicago truncatula]|uniref:DUF223 domain protein n=1 Tax=Medicago truncatula TaxID=3880 RepID=G7JLV9_MEDTR|nr:DUF223 domain protein [Medicago truncatula]